MGGSYGDVRLKVLCSAAFLLGLTMSAGLKEASTSRLDF